LASQPQQSNLLTSTASGGAFSIYLPKGKTMLGIGILQLALALLGPIAVAGVFLYFAVRRVRKKLDPANKPTTWQFINELGGYAVLAAIFLLYAVFALLSKLFS